MTLATHRLHIGVQFGFLLALIIALGMLGGDHDRRRGDRRAAFVAQRDLALGIRLQERRRARMAIGSHLLENLVAVIECRRHQVGRIVGRIAEHDALIARAFVLVAACVHALRDMRRLAVQMVVELEGFPVETVLLIADLLDSVAHCRLDLLKRAGRPLVIFINALAADFAGKNNELRRRQRLAGDARLRILGEKQIDDGIADLVRDLVRMTFGHAFGREKIGGTHCREGLSSSGSVVRN